MWSVFPRRQNHQRRGSKHKVYVREEADASTKYQQHLYSVDGMQDGDPQGGRGNAVDAAARTARVGGVPVDAASKIAPNADGRSIPGSPANTLLPTRRSISAWFRPHSAALFLKAASLFSKDAVAKILPGEHRTSHNAWPASDSDFNARLARRGSGSDLSASEAPDIAAVGVQLYRIWGHLLQGRASGSP